MVSYRVTTAATLHNPRQQRPCLARLVGHCRQGLRCCCCVRVCSFWTASYCVHAHYRARVRLMTRVFPRLTRMPKKCVDRWNLPSTGRMSALCGRVPTASHCACSVFAPTACAALRRGTSLPTAHEEPYLLTAEPLMPMYQQSAGDRAARKRSRTPNRLHPAPLYRLSYDGSVKLTCDYPRCDAVYRSLS